MLASRLSLPTLRVRLLLVAGLGLLATLAVLVGAIVLAQEAAIESAKAGAKQSVSLIANRYRAQVQAAHNLLLAVSRIDEVRDGPLEACTATLAEMDANVVGYTTFGVISAGGEVVCTGRPLTRTISVRQRPFWRRVIETRSFSLGDYGIGSVSGEPNVAAALPRLGPAGEILQVFTVGLSIRWFHQIAEQIELPWHGSLLLLDEAGHVLAGTAAGRWRLGDDLAVSPLGRVIQSFDAPENAVRTDEVADWIVAHGQLGREPSRIHALVVWDRDLVIGNALWEWTLGPLVAGLMVILIFAALAHWHWRTITRHLDRLLAAARAMAGGDLGTRVTLQGRAPDLEELAEAFNGMAAALEVRDQELRAQNQRLARSNVDLERFAYIASHDLQEPLRSISSFCDLLKRDYGETLDERGRNYLQFVIAGAAQMRRLVQDLLGYARLTSRDLAKAEVSLERLVQDALGQLGSRVSDTGVRVIRDDLPMVAADPAQLQRVLINLIGNSIKYGPSGEAPEITIAAERIANGWEIVFTDNGIGIPAHQADRVFEIFKRLHLQSEYPGTGVGLAEVRAVIERHGGRIWIDTDYTGPGTRFRFTLPDLGAAICAPVLPYAFASPAHSAAPDEATTNPPAIST